MKFWALLLVVTLPLVSSPIAVADTCNTTPFPFFGAKPITDFDVNMKYRGLFPGLLYDGSNTPPPCHDSDGRALAALIQPRLTDGTVNTTSGEVIFLSIGFSNNTIEFCGGATCYDTDGSQDDPAATACPPPAPVSSCTQQTCPFNSEANQQSFMAQAFSDSSINHNGRLVLVDGAKGGETLLDWDPFDPSNPHCNQPEGCWYNYDRIDNILTSNPNFTFSANQIQSIWIKDANPNPTVALCPPYPQPCSGANPDADALTSERYMGDILRAVRQRYANLVQVFVSPRIYGGYSNTSHDCSNQDGTGILCLQPEPFAFETGFSIKWLVAAQIEEVNPNGHKDPIAGDIRYHVPPQLGDAAPWVDWGPYLWADGPHARNDNFPGWFPPDLRGTNGSGDNNECTHPSVNGEAKVGRMLLNFVKGSHYTTWILGQ